MSASQLPLMALVCLLLAAPVAAQRRTSGAAASRERPFVGPQAGFATHDLDLFIGGQLAYRVMRQLDACPSLEIYFPSGPGSAWALNANVRYWPQLSMPKAGLYVGGGLNFTHTSAFGYGDSNLGLGLLGGWDFQAVAWRPFAELRIFLGHADRLELGGGINFRL